MTKQTKPDAAVTTDVIEPVAATVATTPKAEALHIFAAIPHALSEAVVHIRNGMTFDTDLPMEVFGATGQISFYLKRGNPDAHYVEVANESNVQAVEMESARYERQVQEAAIKLIADQKKAAAMADTAERVAETETLLRALKRQQAAQAANQ